MSKSKFVLFSVILFGLASAAYADDNQVQMPEVQQSPVTPEAQVPATQPTDTATAQDPTAQSLAGQTPDPGKRDPDHPYEIQYFFADFQRFDIGSVVPDRYRTKKYEIIDWKTRNLPAPVEETSWTYMGGNYVLISKADGKILKAESGDIFYKQ